MCTDADTAAGKTVRFMVSLDKSIALTVSQESVQHFQLANHLDVSKLLEFLYAM